MHFHLETLTAKKPGAWPGFLGYAADAAAPAYLLRPANRVQVPTTVSGLSDIESMP
jgi:hypothetical protein